MRKPTEYNRVLEYLQRKETGGFGWVPKYEDETKGDSSAAYMTGWYAGMLNEVIDAIGPERLRRLLYALQEIDEGKG